MQHDFVSTKNKKDQKEMKLEGASRYINGKVTRFDQKNEGFKRPFWDPKMAEVFEQFYSAEVPPKTRPGYELKDQSAVNASWILDSKYANGNNGGRKGLYGWEWDGNFEFPRVPKGCKTTESDPAMLTQQVKKMASFFGASLCGVCKVDERWLYSAAFIGDENGGRTEQVDLPKSCKNAVVFAFEMDYEAIKYSPAHPASITVGLGYSKMAFTTGLVAQFIRGLGFQAIPSGNDTACSIPLAIDAGLGEIARNGLLVTPFFGPRVRLAKIFTDMPLVPNTPIEFGVWEFCRVCKKCADKCPSNSIEKEDPTGKPHNISNREGILKWHVNAETCLSWWAANGTDCSNCIRICPFNKPKGLLHDLVRYGIKNFKGLHNLFLWGDDMMGYGKRVKADQFWRS
jgi:epoxyqueuosine reductase